MMSTVHQPESAPVRRPSFLGTRRSRIAVVALTIMAAIVGVVLAFTIGRKNETTVDSVVATLRVPGPPNWLTAGDDALWVSLNPLAAGNSGANLVRINLATGAVEKSVSLGGVVPSSIRVGDSLWLTHEPDGSDAKPGEVLELDWRTGEILGRLQFDRPIGALAYGDGSLWIEQVRPGAVIRVDPATRRRIGESVPVSQNAARGLAFGAGAVWATAFEDGALVRIDPATGRTSRVAVGQFPVGAVVANGSVWVANRGSGTLSRVDPETMKVTAEIGLGHNPTWIGAAAGSVWVANQTDGTVDRVDATTGKKVGAPIRIAGGGTGNSLQAAAQAVSVADGSVWVTSMTAKTVSRIDTSR
jgi:YVTN family beta-propeller protein